MSRLELREHAPDGYKAVLALDRYLRESLADTLLEIVNLRASQLNGCAFCVDLHATNLERSGVPTRKIYAVSVWRETDGFFDDSERAALALTEEATRLSEGVDETTWSEAARVFPERTLADLVLAIGTINLWNRIGVTTHQGPHPLHS